MFTKIAISSKGIPYSRYILSWLNVGGHYASKEFVEWLKKEGLNDDEINEMKEIFSWGGKFELEQSARPFVQHYLQRLKELEERNG